MNSRTGMNRKTDVYQKYEQQGVAMTCRSFREYEHIFMLTPEKLQNGPILDVAAGASSFVAEANHRGYQALAVDPLYQESAELLTERGRQEIKEHTQKIARVSHLFQWDFYGSLNAHYANRIESLARFSDDFQTYRGDRYVQGSLPKMPFADETFSLVICSHFLFLYGEQFDYSFHLASLRELIRVCRKDGEICIFPLVGFDGTLCPHLQSLQSELAGGGIKTELVPTDFRFLKGATEILRITKGKL